MASGGGARRAWATVEGESFEIWVAKTGGSTWMAWGNFRGNHIEVTGSSESAAINRWAERADYVARE